MTSRLSILLGLVAIPAISAAILPSHNNAAADPNMGFVSFPIQRGDRSTRTLSGRQASASLVNVQDTSYLIDRKLILPARVAAASNLHVAHIHRASDPRTKNQEPRERVKMLTAPLPPQ